MLQPNAEPESGFKTFHLSVTEQTLRRKYNYDFYKPSASVLAMSNGSGKPLSPVRRQAADALRRARKLPIGHARNSLQNLRQVTEA